MATGSAEAAFAVLSYLEPLTRQVLLSFQAFEAFWLCLFSLRKCSFWSISPDTKNKGTPTVWGEGPPHSHPTPWFLNSASG